MMSFRKIATILSIFLVVVLIYFGWEDIKQAVQLADKVNLWILSLIIPVQIVSYYASGAILTSYLKAKGNLQKINFLQVTRFALEFNFVNHILPSGGISGLSYSTWRFRKLGVPPSRTTLANVLRAALVFLVLVVGLVISVYILALKGDVNRLLLVTASSVSTLIVVGVIFAAFIVNSHWRAVAAGRRVAVTINSINKRIFRRKERIISQEKVEAFFLEMHEDYRQIRKKPHQIKLPFVWSVVFVIMEILMYFIVFASFGYVVSPAALLVGYVVAGAAGIAVATPGGAGAFEAVMVAILAGAGVPGSISIAAVVLTRVILVLFALTSGYIFYQLTLLKNYEKPAVKFGE